MISAGEEVGKTCPRGMMFQPQEGAVHPDKPEFCIEVEEVSQEEDNAFRAGRARTGFELFIRLTNGRTERNASASESSLRTIAAAQVQRNDVSGIDIGSVAAQIPQPKGKLAGPRKPAVLRTRDEAREYCQAKYPGGDLPTERQWENACGSGDYCTVSGELRHTEARFDNNSEKGPGNVDWYPVNARGTRNMTGNACEWTRGNTSDGYAVIRGGSWSHNNYFGYLRADNRDSYHPDIRLYDVGFRCVAPPALSERK